MSLICWWPLNGDTKNYGTLGGEIEVAASSPVYTSGKIGQALYTGTLNLTAEQWKKIIGNTISIAMWIYTRDDGSYSAGVPFFGMSGMTPPNNRKFSMFHYNTKTNLHCSWQNDDSSSTYWSCHYTDFFELNKWIHLCIVQDAATNTVTVYRNGEQYSKSTVSGLSSMNFKEAGAAPIRANINYQHMNDIRIYDHALSVAEVKEISKALLVHYTFDDLCAKPTTNLLPASQQTQSNTAATIEVTSGLVNGATYTLSTYVTRDPACTSTNPRLTLRFFYSDGTNTAVSKYNDGGASYPKDGVERYYFITATANPAKTLTAVGGWLMDHSSGSGKKMTATRSQLEIGAYPTPYTPSTRTSMIIDESSYDHPTVLVNDCEFVTDTNSGTVALHTAGAGDTASFGACSYLRADMKTSITPAAFTVSMWAKVNTWGKQTSGVLSFNTSTDPTGYLTSTFVQYDGNFRLNNSASTAQSSISSGIVTLGEWHHYAFTWDGANLKGYKDGALYNTVAAAFVPDPFRYVFLGVDRAGGAVRDADVTWGNFKVYMTALSAEDIEIESKARALITDKGDIETHQFIESKTQAQVTSKYSFEADEFYEELYSDYDVLEYIESTGTQYVDTGYITTSTDYTYELDMAPTKIGGFYSYMGFMASGTTPRAGIHEYSNVFMLGANATTNSSTTPVVNERVVLKGHFKSGAQKLYKNDVLIASNSTSFNHSANTLSTHIFGRNYSNGRNLTSIKLYSAKIYEGSTLVRHYIPVRRQSDNALGLYDILTDTFCANSGSGTFTSGPAITNKSASIYEDMHVSGREIIEI